MYSFLKVLVLALIVPKFFCENSAESELKTFSTDIFPSFMIPFKNTVGTYFEIETKVENFLTTFEVILNNLGATSPISESEPRKSSSIY